MQIANITIKKNFDAAIRGNHCLVTAPVLENEKCIAVLVIDYYQRDRQGNKSPGFYIAVRPAGNCEGYRPVIREAYYGGFQFGVSRETQIGLDLYKFLVKNEDAIRSGRF